MQMRAIVDENAVARRQWPRLFLLVAIAIAGGQNVRAQSGGPAPAEFPRALRNKDRAVRPVLARTDGDRPDLKAQRVEVSTNEVRTESPAVAGAKLVLDAGRGAPEGTRFRWVQVEGPSVDFGDPSRATIEIIIPSGAEKLAFMVVATSAEVVRVIRVNVPLQGDPSRTSWGTTPSGKVKADAGDDQIGLIGHRVTLNGSKSKPGEGKNARWLQVGGPAVLSAQQQGLFFSFVPTSPALYEFLLMVASDGELSEPDEVSVLVGSPPGTAGAVAQPAPGLIAAPAPPSPPSPEQLLSEALPKLSAGTRLAADVADAMEAISWRANLYESFAALQSELARRLDVLIPTEPSQREAWAVGVFGPLTASTTSQLLAVGVDVRQPQGLTHPLTPAQKAKVRDHFERLARAFRAAATTR
jgi:hypothetical protein